MYSQKQELLVSYNDGLHFIFDEFMSVGTSCQKLVVYERECYNQEDFGSESTGPHQEDDEEQEADDEEQESDEEMQYYAEHWVVYEEHWEDDEEQEGDEEQEDDEEEVVEFYQVRGMACGQVVKIFGPNTEYIVEGKFGGRILTLRKKGGFKFVANLKADVHGVNSLEPHPHATILASGGADRTVKVWATIS